MAFGDAEGVIHLLSQAHDSDEDVPFNGFVGQPVQWPDIPAPIPDNEWTDSTYDFCSDSVLDSEAT